MTEVKALAKILEANRKATHQLLPKRSVRLAAQPIDRHAPHSFSSAAPFGNVVPGKMAERLRHTVAPQERGHGGEKPSEMNQFTLQRTEVSAVNHLKVHDPRRIERLEVGGVTGTASRS